jgi:CBS domain-containing protein
MDTRHAETGHAREVGVAEIMSRHVVAIRSDSDLTVAVATFLRTALRQLVVVEPDLSCRGVLSREQVLAALATTELGRRRERRVGEHVPPGQPRLHRAASVRRAAEVMSSELVDALPVVDDEGGVVGIVTWSDIVALAALPGPPTTYPDEP